MSKSIWKKTKLSLVSGALALTLTYSATNLIALAADNTKPEITQTVKKNYVKITFDNRVLFHEQVPTESIIQILDTDSEVLESKVLTGDLEKELEAPKIEKGSMLSYWAVEKTENRMTIFPVLISEKELSVKFVTTDGGQLLENNALTREIVKSINKDAKLKDILPEVSPKEHYKFTGWFESVSTLEGIKAEEKLKDIDDIKVNDSGKEYHAKFYPDYNDNGIDDRTEELTVKFVTNSQEKIADVNTKAGDRIELPALKNKDSIFLGWYTDGEFKNKFTNDVITKSLVLYAKWGKADKVIAESEKNPITDKDISDQVEKILKDRLKDLDINKNNTQTPVKATTQTPSNNLNNSNSTEKPSYDSNAFKKVKYVFDNKNVGQIYMVKFFDEHESFLFSLALPYGKTIKTYDENELFQEEYAVRQETTITLNTNHYINGDSELIGFDTREVRMNSTLITEVFPNVKSKKNENLAYSQAQAIKAEKEKSIEKKKKNTIVGISIGLVLIAAIGIMFYLFKRKRKLAQM
ncbi:InlB B-repeat-containing protein [Lysinibacillus sp. NPDC096418]|uniref:InlB B-repeat-containing protein n=1 Tax=Lysinibacillus sp. NPDC096418 TaxID=3364138 RepID=UPI00380AD287